MSKSRFVDNVLQLTVVAVAMALIATAFGWQAEAAWIAVAWAVQGIALWWFGLRILSRPLRGLGTAFMIMAAWRLLLIDTARAHPEPFVPLLNKYGIPATLVACSFLAAALTSRRYLAWTGELGLIAMRVLGLAGVCLLWFVLSFEVYEYFDVQRGQL